MVRASVIREYICWSGIHVRDGGARPVLFIHGLDLPRNWQRWIRRTCARFVNASIDDIGICVPGETPARRAGPRPLFEQLLRPRPVAIVGDSSKPSDGFGMLCFFPL
jgi:hypothetical protein